MGNLKQAYIDNEHSRYWLGQAEWAQGILSSECVIFQNGRPSHEVALEVLELAEDELLDDYAIHVTG